MDENKEKMNAQDTDEETMLQEEDEILTLENEDGEVEEFYILGELDYKGKWYLYLEPVEPDEDFEDGDVLILESVENEDGTETFQTVEDDDLQKTLMDMFLKELDEE